ncbi:hypothetical protein [Arthrobacter sp. S2(2024)]|uniref:hypothetical protein n=1 Tax=Arthrobacter sp. S2(2024) TaxID=3111911 RepID=UPI002FC76C2D
MTSKDGSNILVDDEIGNWWSVLLWGNSPTDFLPAESLAQLKLMGAGLVCLLPETRRTWAEENMDSDVLVLGDHTGQIKKWFDDRPPRWWSSARTNSSPVPASCRIHRPP